MRLAYWGGDGRLTSMLSYPHIDPVIFSIGVVKIRWYGLMYVIGFLLAWWLAKKRALRSWSAIKPTQVDDLIFYSMLRKEYNITYCFSIGVNCRDRGHWFLRLSSRNRQRFAGHH
jgi:hypothetical protein